MSGSSRSVMNTWKRCPSMIGERQLGAGVWLFTTHDHAGAVRPTGQIDEVGDLSDLRVVAFVDPIGGHRGLPTPFRDR